MRDDYDDHNEAMAAEEERRIEDVYLRERAIAEHLADLERDDDGRRTT